jgi:hypothetical protein
MVTFLAEHGVDFNTPENDGATPVFIAAQKGRVLVVKVLAMYKADINTSNNDGTTPVYVVLVLAKHKADLYSSQSDGAIPICTAAQLIQCPGYALPYLKIFRVRWVWYREVCICIRWKMIIKWCLYFLFMGRASCLF